MSDFENKQVNGYVYYTRFFASWIRSGGDPIYLRKERGFEDWLRHLGLNEEDINGIMFLAENGRLELETDAKRFLKEG